MNIHESQLFWCELQGYKVLTHCHMMFSSGSLWMKTTSQSFEERCSGWEWSVDALQSTDCPDWPGKNKKWNPARALGGESCLVDTFRADVNAMLVTPWCWEMASVLYSCYSHFNVNIRTKAQARKTVQVMSAAESPRKYSYTLTQSRLMPFVAVSANWSPSISELCDCRIFHWTADDHFHTTCNLSTCRTSSPCFSQPLLPLCRTWLAFIKQRLCLLVEGKMQIELVN